MKINRRPRKGKNIDTTPIEVAKISGRYKILAAALTVTLPIIIGYFLHIREQPITPEQIKPKEEITTSLSKEEKPDKSIVKSDKINNESAPAVSTVYDLKEGQKPYLVFVNLSGKNATLLVNDLTPHYRLDHSQRKQVLVNNSSVPHKFTAKTGLKILSEKLQLIHKDSMQINLIWE